MKKLKIELFGRSREWCIELPHRAVVCSRCGGEGTHVNPNIDGNGISPEEFEADPEFQENYFSGVYDVPCHKCGGNRVVWEVAEDALTKRQRVLWQNHLRVLRVGHSERDSEERWGY